MTYWHMIAPLVIAGAGISMAIPSAQNAVMNAVAPADLGKASGTFMTMRQLGGVFGLAIAAAVFTGAGSYASPAAFCRRLRPGPDGVGGVVGGRRAPGGPSAPSYPPDGGFCRGSVGRETRSPSPVAPSRSRSNSGI